MIEQSRVPRLKGKKIGLIVTGGIAAYKSAYLVRELRREGANVKVVMTNSAKEFVAPLTFATLSGNDVLDNMFPANAPNEPIHLSLNNWADLLVIAPATANFIGKIANGIADDIASSVAMAHSGLIVIAPAMNPRMWSNDAVQANVEKIRKRNVLFVGPEEGQMGGVSEEEGKGRMSEPNDIVEKLVPCLLLNKTWVGVRVLVTAGATIEKIDPVRYVSNHSSGKMGVAIAKYAVSQGAKVTLIHGKSVDVSNKGYIDCVAVETANDMFNAVKERFVNSDVLFMAAAVSDWTIANVKDQKIKKTHGYPDIKWKETEDILAWAGKNRKKQFIVGFALETENHVDEAFKKLVAKNIDVIALNDATQEHSSFGGETSKLTIITKVGQPLELPVMLKYDAAGRLLKEVERYLPKK